MSDKKTEKSIVPEKPKMPSRKHLQFIEEYLSHFNASKAYGAVFGRKEGHARDVDASALLRRSDVQQYLNKRLAERKQELHLDTSYVIRKLNEIIDTDYISGTQYLTKDQLDKLPEATRKLVQSVEIQKTKSSSRDFENETTKYKVTFMSKDNAITLLGKHTGAFIKDNVNVNLNIDQASFTDALKQLDI